MDKTEKLDIEDIPKRKRKLKKWVKYVLNLFAIIVVVLILLIVFYLYLLQPVSSGSKIVDFKVKTGSSVYSIGYELKEKKLIRSINAYKVYVKLNNINEYKAGTYKLDESYSTSEIVKILTGDTYKENGSKITFKEGITIKNLVKKVSTSTNITESEFYAKLEDKAYLNKLINKYWFLTDDIKNENIYYALEGYLFANTYVFEDNSKPEDIIETLLDETDRVFTKYKDDFNNSKYSIHEIVTLSSVVEQEGIHKEDKKNIASVFYNRLNSNMSLGSDVTTYYGCKVELGQRELTYDEINTYNPYNTRGPLMNGKLPVGPISNFSEESLEATLRPNKTKYLYFVADKKGNTHFTKTYDEHQKVIKELKESGNWIEL